MKGLLGLPGMRLSGQLRVEQKTLTKRAAMKGHRVADKEDLIMVTGKRWQEEMRRVEKEESIQEREIE